MKKILTILLTIISINLFSDENIGYRVNFYDTIEFKSPFILQNGDTCEIFLVNDSICMKCNSGDTVRIDGTTVNLSNYPDRTELGDTASAVEIRANDYTDNVNVNYSVSLSSDLNSLSPSINETAFVAETGKNYYWDGIEWNEITASVSITDNQISFSQSTLEEIVDYNQLDTLNYIASNPFNMANASSLTLWNILNSTNDDYLVTGRKRTDITYQGGTNIHTGGTFSDYFLAFDDSMRVVASNTYGTDNSNNIHSMYQGHKNNIFRSMLTQGSFVINGTTYTTTSLGIVDGYMIIEDGDTYIADTVYPIFTGTGTTQITVSDYDIYNDINYITGRTQGDTFVIHSQNGINDTIIQTGSQSLCIIKYDTNFYIIDTLIMKVSSITSQNIQIEVTENYVYYLVSINGTITINDSIFTTSATNPFIIKFNKNLEIIYVRTIKSLLTVGIYDFNIDENDNIRFTFGVIGDYTIQTTDSTFTSTKSNIYGGTDAGEVTWNTDGDYVTDYIIGGTGNDLIQSSVKNKDFSLVSGYSSSTSMTIGDSILNHGVTNFDPFLIYINNITGNMIAGTFGLFNAQSAQLKKILKSENTDYIYGALLIDDPAIGTITIGDSIYTSPGTGNQYTIPIKWGCENYKQVLGLNHDKVFIGDYYNGKYVEYDTTTHSMTYYDPPSSFSGNQIPSMTAVQTEISEIDSSWNSININKLQSKDNDSIIVDSVIYFNSAIKLKVKVFSFSVDKDLDYSDANAGIITITNNCTLEAINLPPGVPVMLWLRWSGGDYTVTLSNMTQMVGNTQTLQELNGAKDIIQLTLDPWDGTIDYVIINKYTP